MHFERFFPFEVSVVLITVTLYIHSHLYALVHLMHPVSHHTLRYS